MKLNSLMLMTVLAASVMCGTNVRAQRTPPPTPPVPAPLPHVKVKPVEKTEKKKVKVTKTVEREERSVAVEPDVVITLCMESGRVSVRGTDQHEVRAELPKSMKIDFRRADGTDNDTPAKRLEVMLSQSSDEDEGEDEGKDKDESAPHFGQCSGSGDIELEVPQGATLFFKSDNADFDIDTVAEVHIETHSGRIALSHITRATEATSIDGDVSLEDSSGRVRLESFGGSVEASNVSKNAEGDFFRAKSISNDVMLENVSHSRVEVSTISGEVVMRGPLARAGVYDLRTTSGDITLTMPVDSSFKLTAKVSESGEIVTDFPLKYTGGISTSTSLSSGRMIGIYGKGDATINLISFSGTLRLRKQ